ncbi:CING protein, partial [Upupa epops]|nr:CING protein [Upupa epops]
APAMDRPVMAEKQNPVDYGVQIRFINDLQEPRRPPKARSKPGSYGVAVRVQGIAGQPFVVLNSGDKGSDSFGVQIKSEGSYPNPSSGPQASGSISSDSDLPENPYGGQQPWHSLVHSTSNGQASSGTRRSQHNPKALPEKGLLGDKLRRTQSHGDLLSAATDEAVDTSWAGGNRQHQLLDSGKSSSMWSITPEWSETGGSKGKEAASDTAAVGDVDTKPLSSVDSLISKFNGKGPLLRGRAPRRGRIPSEERKRSQSLDGRLSQQQHCRNTPLHLQPLVPNVGMRNQRGSRGAEEPGNERVQKKIQAELQVLEGWILLGSWWCSGAPRGLSMGRFSCPSWGFSWQLKSTPDLLRDQQEVAQPGSSDHPKELIYCILKEGSSESEISLKKKTTRLLEKMQELVASPKDSACSQHKELARKVEELQEKLDEETKLRQKLELLQEPARSGSAWLREVEGESQQLRGALEKKNQELQRTLQELEAVKSAKEQVEKQLGACKEQLLAMHRELDCLRKGSSTTPDTDALYKELLETREELEEALNSKQQQEEQLRLRERELTALKGALKEEVASHDKELDHMRQQYQNDMETLRRSMEDISQDQANLESERQKMSSMVRNLQRELEESTEETGHWRDMFQKNKDELRNTKQELLQVKLEREEFEEELRELRDRFAAARDEVEQARSSLRNPGELEALRKELQKVREAQRELVAEKESQEELLQQREQELAVLRGTMEKETSSHHGELEQYRRDLQQLQEERDEATKAKAYLESAREMSEQARRTVETSLRELQEQNDDLRRKVLGMETQLKEYEQLGNNWEGSQARLKDKVTKLEVERRQLEESLGEVTEREQELLLAKRALELRLEEAQRGLSRLTQEHQELSVSFQDEQRQKEQFKRAKNELEEQKRLLDRTTEKLNKELEQMTAQSQGSLAALQSQLEEFKEKSRKELTDSQRQAKDRGAEVEKMQFNMGRLQDEVSKLRQALQDSQAQRDSVLLDKEVLLQRLQSLEQDLEAKRRLQDDRLRHLKALEEKSKCLEEELEEEKATVELLTERVNRSRDQIDQLRAELLQERSSRQDLECDKVSLERQNKELKNRLASSEGMHKPSTSFSQLEARLDELQDKLQAEEREKNILLSSNRKLERRVKELTIQIDDERQHVSDQKDQLSLRVKALKRQVDEAEEEIERLEGARKKAQRELEEQHELNEQLQNRIKALEKEAWRRAARSATDSSLQDDDGLSSDEELDSAYGPSSIASLLNEANLQTSSC